MTLEIPSNTLSIASFDSKVPTGFPSPAMDYIEKRIDLNEVLIKHPLSTFLCESEGLSMIQAFIPPKAIAVKIDNGAADNVTENGWTFWKYIDDNGIEKKITELRK